MSYKFLPLNLTLVKKCNRKHYFDIEVNLKTIANGLHSGVFQLIINNVFLQKLSFEESRKPHVRTRHSVDLNRNFTMGPGNRSPRWRIATVVEDQEVVKQGWLAKQNRSVSYF